MAPKLYYGDRYYNWPQIDILSLLFDSPYALAKEDTKIHIDATNSSNYLTKADCRDRLEAFAHGIRTHFGIGTSGNSKDVVIGFSDLEILLPIAFYGVIAAGGIFSCASHSFTAAELARQIQDGDARVVICSPRLKDVAIRAARMCNIGMANVLVLDSSYREWSCRSIEGGNEMFGLQRLTWNRITEPEKIENSVVGLLYSSGTTGAPKGVRLSHQMLVSQIYVNSQVAREWAIPRLLSGELKPTELRTLAHLPAAHIAGISGYFINPLYSGTSCYWMKTYSWKDFLRYNKEHKITAFFTVPAIWARIAKSPDVTDQFDSLQAGLGGAAPMDAELANTAGRRSGIQIGGTYGMSETCGSVCTLRRGMEDNTGSVGVIHPNVVLRLIGDDGKDVAPGEPGELWVKGPGVTKGYWRNEKATKEAFEDGWYKSGDILQNPGKDGLWYVTDRKKELIKYKGIQVAPAELEGLLLSHPLIDDAAVIGVPGTGEGERDTEVPRAYIVVRSSSSVADGDVARKEISAEEVQDFVKARLAPYKQLRGGVVFLDQIPRSAVGKILRKDLRDMAKREMQAKL